MIDGKTGIIAHIGYPTESFKSPMIYNPWFAARGINAAFAARKAAKETSQKKAEEADKATSHARQLDKDAKEALHQGRPEAPELALPVVRPEHEAVVQRARAASRRRRG